MKSMTFPPTHSDRVLERLKCSKELAAECGAENIVVTYDLAIAKKAKHVQCAEQRSFGNIYIPFGQLHIELNIFSSLGKLIEGSIYTG